MVGIFTGGLMYLLFLIGLIALFVVWPCVYCVRKKGLIGFLLWLFLPILGVIIVMLLPSDKDKKRENESGTFYCNSCIELN